MFIFSAFRRKLYVIYVIKSRKCFALPIFALFFSKGSECSSIEIRIYRQFGEQEEEENDGMLLKKDFSDMEGCVLSLFGTMVEMC